MAAGAMAHAPPASSRVLSLVCVCVCVCTSMAPGGHERTRAKAPPLCHRLAGLVPVLREKGKSHMGYGAQPEHYDWVGAALLGALHEALGDAVMTAGVTEAYVSVYTLVKVTMLGPEMEARDGRSFGAE